MRAAGALRPRLLGYAAGGLLIVVGLREILTAPSVPLTGWAVWFAGAAIADDLVVIPLVLLAGRLLGWVPAAYRSRVQGGLIVAAALTAVGLVPVLGLGRDPANPSLLPLPYGRDLALLIAADVAVTALLVAAARRGASRRHRPTASGDGTPSG